MLAAGEPAPTPRVLGLELGLGLGLGLGFWVTGADAERGPAAVGERERRV